VKPRRGWYLVLLTLLGLGTAIYGLIRHDVFWTFVGLAWLFVAVTQVVIAGRR